MPGHGRGAKEPGGGEEVVFVIVAVLQRALPNAAVPVREETPDAAVSASHLKKEAAKWLSSSAN